VLALSEGYRSDRVQSWLNPGADSQGAGYQARQARFALANGGVFGDGLGQGTAKWNYLPNAHNDFIFAIIGEELGLIGASGLLALFGLFAYTGMRIARRSVDPFLRLLSATTTLWLIGQMFINVGYVVGLLPVTGLQLPLISAGGSSQATTLLMMGLLTNAARHEPDAVAALRAGRDDRVDRLLHLPLPEPYVPSRLESVRDRLSSRKATGKPSKVKPKSKAPAGKAAAKSRTKSAPRGSRSGATSGAKTGARSGARTAAKQTGRNRTSDRAAGSRRAAPAGERAARRRTAAQQPGGSGRSSVRYGADQRSQGRRARALEGQRYG
jgi:cell division protein FtsW